MNILEYDSWQSHIDNIFNQLKSEGPDSEGQGALHILSCRWLNDLLDVQHGGQVYILEASQVCLPVTNFSLNVSCNSTKEFLFSNGSDTCHWKGLNAISFAIACLTLAGVLGWVTWRV